jgi:hypothetical protein
MYARTRVHERPNACTHARAHTDTRATRTNAGTIPASLAQRVRERGSFAAAAASKPRADELVRPSPAPPSCTPLRCPPLSIPGARIFLFVNYRYLVRYSLLPLSSCGERTPRGAGVPDTHIEPPHASTHADHTPHSLTHSRTLTHARTPMLAYARTHARTHARAHAGSTTGEVAAQAEHGATPQPRSRRRRPQPRCSALARRSRSRARTRGLPRDARCSGGARTLR